MTFHVCFFIGSQCFCQGCSTKGMCLYRGVYWHSCPRYSTDLFSTACPSSGEASDERKSGTQKWALSWSTQTLFPSRLHPHTLEIRASLLSKDQFSPKKVMKSQERKLNPGNSLLRSQIRHLDNELELLIAAQPFIHMTHYLSGRDTQARVLFAPVKTILFFQP